MSGRRKPNAYFPEDSLNENDAILASPLRPSSDFRPKLRREAVRERPKAVERPRTGAYYGELVFPLVQKPLWKPRPTQSAEFYRARDALPAVAFSRNFLKVVVEAFARREQGVLKAGVLLGRVRAEKPLLEGSRREASERILTQSLLGSQKPLVALGASPCGSKQLFTVLLDGFEEVGCLANSGAEKYRDVEASVLSSETGAKVYDGVAEEAEKLVGLATGFLAALSESETAQELSYMYEAASTGLLLQPHVMVEKVVDQRGPMLLDDNVVEESTVTEFEVALYGWCLAPAFQLRCIEVLPMPLLRTPLAYVLLGEDSSTSAHADDLQQESGETQRFDLRGRDGHLGYFGGEESKGTAHNEQTSSSKSSSWGYLAMHANRCVLPLAEDDIRMRDANKASSIGIWVNIGRLDEVAIYGCAAGPQRASVASELFRLPWVYRTCVDYALSSHRDKFLVGVFGGSRCRSHLHRSKGVDAQDISPFLGGFNVFEIQLLPVPEVLASGKDTLDLRRPEFELLDFKLRLRVELGPEEQADNAETAVAVAAFRETSNLTALSALSRAGLRGLPNREGVRGTLTSHRESVEIAKTGTTSRAVPQVSEARPSMPASTEEKVDTKLQEVSEAKLPGSSVATAGERPQRTVDPKVSKLLKSQEEQIHALQNRCRELERALAAATEELRENSRDRPSPQEPAETKGPQRHAEITEQGTAEASRQPADGVPVFYGDLDEAEQLTLSLAAGTGVFRVPSGRVDAGDDKDGKEKAATESDNAMKEGNEDASSFAGGIGDDQEDDEDIDAEESVLLYRLVAPTLPTLPDEVGSASRREQSSSPPASIMAEISEDPRQRVYLGADEDIPRITYTVEPLQLADDEEDDEEDGEEDM